MLPTQGARLTPWGELPAGDAAQLVNVFALFDPESTCLDWQDEDRIAEFEPLRNRSYLVHDWLLFDEVNRWGSPGMEAVSERFSASDDAGRRAFAGALIAAVGDCDPGAAIAADDLLAPLP